MFSKVFLNVAMGLLTIAISGVATAQPVSDYRTYRNSLHQNSNAGIGALFSEGTWDGIESQPDVARRGDGSIRYFRAPEGHGLALDSSGIAGFLARHAAAFGLYDTRADGRTKEPSYGLVRYRQTETRGRQYHRYRQTYFGRQVAGAEIIVQTSADGTKIQAIFADLMRDTYSLDSTEGSLEAKLTAEQAKTAARASLADELDGRSAFHRDALSTAEAREVVTSDRLQTAREQLDSTVLIDAAEPELIIYAPEVSGKEGPARLVYRASVVSRPSHMLGTWVYIDAATGDVLGRESWIHRAFSRDVYDAAGGISEGAATLERAQGDPVSGIQPVDANYGQLWWAYKYFKDQHGWLSYDDADGHVDSYVDWGTSGMAEWDDANGTFHFGPDGWHNSRDIIGHEFTHAILLHTWEPTMTGESGAIAESICDLFGEFTQWHNAAPAAGHRWRIGEHVTGGFIRDMEDPQFRGDPSFMGSSNYYHGTNDDTYIHTNNGVGNKFWFLLTDGQTGFRSIDVTGLGQSVVEALAWEATQVMPTGASYYDLFSAVRGAAKDFYDGTTTPTEEDALASIDAAGLALGIDADMTTGVGTGNKSVGSFDPTLFNTWTGALYTGADTSYAKHKDILYRVYVPEDGRDLGDRGDADWPLDVIILSHGAGGQRNIGLGYEDPTDGLDIIDENATNDDDIDGLALHWSKMGYIVVAPTYTKRRYDNGNWEWEQPENRDTVEKFVTDFLAASRMQPEEFFVDRLRDLRFVRDNLSGIINSFTGTQQPFDSTSSKIALAGHSYGAVTTMLAAGAKLEVGADFPLVDKRSILDLEESPHNWLRHFDGGTPGTSVALRADDWGPFIHADAYLLLSGAFDDPIGELQPPANETRVNIKLHNYVRNSLMVVTSENDPSITSEFYTPVSIPTMINDFPTYGVAIEGANHVTPIIHFGYFMAWQIAVLDGISTVLGGEETTSDEATEKAIGEVSDAIDDEVNEKLTLNGRASTTRSFQEPRFKKARKYTLNFFDAHLSPGYDDDTDDDVGKTWLQQSSATHEGTDPTVTLVLDYERKL